MNLSFNGIIVDINDKTLIATILMIDTKEQIEVPLNQTQQAYLELYDLVYVEDNCIREE